MLCGEWTLVKHDYREHLAIPLKCRTWTCDFCHPVRQRELIEQAQRGHPNTFITITVNPENEGTASDRARSLAHAWRRAVRAAKRKYGYATIPFLAVFETTKNGEPHLHILARVKWIDQAWLSNFMRQEIGAPIVDIRRIASKRTIANYVSKYVGKEPHRFEASKRYWSTRDYRVGRRPPEEPKDPSEARWFITQECLETVAGAWQRSNLQCHWEGRKLVGHGRWP